MVQEEAAKAIEKEMETKQIQETIIAMLLGPPAKHAYDTLGVHPYASISEITKKYRTQALYIHPDKSQLPGTQQAFVILTAAYEKA